MYAERDLIVLARAIMKADEWSKHDAEYRPLHRKYQGELREILKSRFNRVAILERWNFTDPAQSSFHIEPLNKAGPDIPERIRQICSTDFGCRKILMKRFLPRPATTTQWAKAAQGAEGTQARRWRLHPLARRNRDEGTDDPALRAREDHDKRSRRESVAGKSRASRTKPHGDACAQVSGTRGGNSTRSCSLMPSASPTSGGSGIETTPVTTATGTGNGRIEPAGGLWDTPSSQPGSKEPPQQAQTAKPRISLIKERTSALNHIGQLEAWGIGPATPVVNVNLKISSATGAQLKDILKKLPDGSHIRSES